MASSLLGSLTVPAASRAAALSRALSPLGPPDTLPGAGTHVFDQGQFPSCVACASATALALLKSPSITLSPQFLYYVVAYQLQRATPGGELRIDGMLQALISKGICTATLHDPPFTSDGASQMPSDAAYVDARQRHLAGGSPFFPPTGYKQCSRPSRSVWLKAQIAARHPVIALIKLPGSYQPFAKPSWRWRKADRSLTDSMHCVVIVGYSDIESAARIQDSRGPLAFDGGCWWMDYSVLENHVAVDGCFALIK